MRILSQDGMIDVPYEQVVIQRFKEKIYFLNKNLTGIEELVDDIALAEYSTETKAKRAMEMLRKAYSPTLVIKEQENGIEPNIKPNDWIVGTIAPAPKIEVYDNFYFQFPSDDELEG